jgi:hypothetical protein
VTAPTQDELRAIGLDDATLSAQWDEVMAQLRAEGRDPEAVAARAGEVLSAWRDHPAVIDGTPRVVGYDVATHLYEPTTNTRCARCNRPREEH